MVDVIDGLTQIEAQGVCSLPASRLSRAWGAWAN